MEHFNDVRILGQFSNHVISVDNFSTSSPLRSFRCSDDSMNDGSKDSILLRDVVTGRRLDIGSIENNIYPIPGKCYTLHTEASIDIRRIADFNRAKNQTTIKILNVDGAAKYRSIQMIH